MNRKMLETCNKMISFLLLIGHVYAHGMLLNPTSMDQANHPSVRNYGAISVDIDSLRSPNHDGTCRGAKSGSIVPISVINGQPFTITLAFSIGAQHIGPCSVQIMNRDDLNSAVTISPNDECARPGVTGFDTNKQSDASSQCPHGLPPGLITNDMCMSEWTFVVSNADQISCTDCVLRWSWTAQHVTPNEFYENCVDVSLDSPPVPSRTPSSTSTTCTDSKTSLATTTFTWPTSTPTPLTPIPDKGLVCGFNSLAPYFECDDQGYHICFAGLLHPIYRLCALGTTCVSQSSTIISCL